MQLLNFKYVRISKGTICIRNIMSGVESLYGVIAGGEECEITADSIGIHAVAVPGKVEVPLVLELPPSPPHVVADKDEDHVHGTLGEVVSEGSHRVEEVVAVHRHNAHLRNGSTS